MSIRSAPCSVARTLTLLAALATAACKSPPATEPMHAGEAHTKPIVHRPIARMQPPPRNADGVIVAPEDCRGSFGDAIAVRGSLVVVGAPKAGDAGKAWVYDAEHLDRAPICLLPPPGVQAERFGAAVSISPAMDRIVVGAPFAEVEGVAEMGRLYGWRREGDTWKFERAFVDPDPSKGPERLGRSVIIDGECIYAGAPNASMELRDDIEVPVKAGKSGDPLEGPDTPTATRTESRLRGRFEREGAVLIWQRDANGAWQGPLYALLPRGRPGARFGSTLARHSLSGEDLLAVGAPPQRTKQGFEGGTVSLFLRRQGSPWRSNAQVVLAPQKAEPSDFFGGSIAMGDNILVVGMAQANLPVAVDAGEVAIFQQDVSTRYWNEGLPSLSSPMEETGSNFGNAVAMMGQVLVVGQPGATRPDGTGRAFVFRKLGEDAPTANGQTPEQPWKPIAELVAPAFLKSQAFGTTMAAGDDWVAVSARSESVSGCVTLFRIDRAASGVTTPAPATATPPAAIEARKMEAPAAAEPVAAKSEPAQPVTETPAAKPEPVAEPAPTTPAAPARDAALTPTAPGALQAGGARPGPLPTKAEPASLYETPPETRPAKDGAVKSPNKGSEPAPPSESPYETPPETPGTKP